MTPEKVLDVIGLYKNFFERLGIDKIDFPHGKFPSRSSAAEEEILPHCHGMLDKMEAFVREGRMEKAFRWLGFIQGCLWSMGYFTLNELKNDNRP